ncbi:hypothetical protein HQ571_04560 [Candidatus Kuenenbacteria bacterium]|nr:hypothetical protein [Candidatus Kuenenbacteria bacterium]
MNLINKAWNVTVTYNTKLAISWGVFALFLICASICIPPAIALIEEGVYHSRSFVTETVFAYTATAGLVSTFADWRYKLIFFNRS